MNNEFNKEVELYNFKINLSITERKSCLKEIKKKIKKILHVFEQSEIPNSGYNYKTYVGSILLYTSSSNELFNGELINILVNLNTIMINNFDKKQMKRIVNEINNITDFLLTKEGEKNECD